MRLKKKITVELNQVDAAIAAVLLSEHAGRQALKALLADKTAEVGGTSNKGSRALAKSYMAVGNALVGAIMNEEGNKGLESTGALVRSTALMGTTAYVANEVISAMEDES